jgi:AcrR family transcriptional regulator
MPPVPRPADKREAILVAALDLFVERGFHGTAVPTVADRAGVGAGTIYRYFQSKEALVNALYQTWKAEVSRRLLDGFDPELPAREQFQHFWDRMGQFVLEHPKVFAFLELHHHASYLDDASRALEERSVQLASALLDQMQKKKIVKSLPVPLLMAVVYGALVGVVRAGWEGKLELNRDTFTIAEQCAWEAIRY